MRSPPRVPRPMQPTPIVLPGEAAERIAGANVVAAASVVAAWLVVRRNSRRFRIECRFMDSGLSIILFNWASIPTVSNAVRFRQFISGRAMALAVGPFPASWLLLRTQLGALNS